MLITLHLKPGSALTPYLFKITLELLASEITKRNNLNVQELKNEKSNRFVFIKMQF
jgi:hypothetical protein